MHPEEIQAHKVGAHARVNCVECHMGRNSTLKLMALKPTHAKELWGMIVGYERPITSGTLRPSREACESCHYPSVEHHDSVAVKVHYATDAESNESRTRIVLHTGMDAIRQGYTKGIHWHIQNEVRFVSPDPQRREIPWVEVRKPDGTKVTYTDAETKLTAQQISALAMIANRKAKLIQFGHPRAGGWVSVAPMIASVWRVEKILTRGAGQSASLADTLYRYFAVDVDKSQRAKFNRKWDGIWTDELVNYALSDVIHLPRLMHEQSEWMARLDLKARYEEQIRTLVRAPRSNSA